ncbi:DAK2 domain-containing protein [Motilibacter deserti]|uniref:DAK2 domain-containing protein n=1 Tax=Motilibacter deserti TaxID=2714956 RepID=A0ABX0GUN3_9ACTN|nr:DAK2 domain-containing protein [Motilibacter deserti]NHC13524.1 DAK2 domain-containing protein [Motilibacter deserti]
MAEADAPQALQLAPRGAGAALAGFDASALRRWCRTSLDALGAAREEIDALNVYPVPDGDTGTNLYLTMEAAHDAVAALPADAPLAQTVRALARGALVGARGNSGIILSQLLRGVAGTLAVEAALETRAADADLLTEALCKATDLSYAAVAHPVEGTMLTVARAAADAARAVSERDLGVVARAAATAARDALARTRDQLEALRRAGVVDAGGAGVCLLLDALAATVTGEPLQPAPLRRAGRPGPALPAATGAHGGARGASPAYEVMYLLDADDAAVPALRERLDGVGESLVVVGGEGLWSVHVHTDDAGAAVEAGIRAGRPHQIRVTAFAASESFDGEGAEHLRVRAVVAVVEGDALAALLAGEGATVVRVAPGARPATERLLDAVRGTGCREAVLLPGGVEGLAVAEAAARQARKAGLRVAVVPVRSPVQAVAAVAVHDAGRRFEDDVVSMTTAAGHMRHGAVTVATAEGLTSAGPCRPGDVLGIVESDFAVVGADLGAVACEVVDRLLAGGGEAVTLLLGEGGDAALAGRVEDHLAAARPDVDVAVLTGGLPGAPLLVGVE